LVSRGFIEIFSQGLFRLTYNGQTFVEEKLLSTYNNKIFLIAACEDEIDRLIEKVYRPAVEHETDYQLKFQEKSEPKGTIHEDIWDYIEGSKLIICDFTHSRPNCFIEYGYALAKEKHIILCIEEKEGKDKNNRLKVPFDTQPQKYSFWKREWLENNDLENLENYKKEIRERINMKLDIIDVQSEI
jgi:nucleoside 2-deoxyribosyltransferase